MGYSTELAQAGRRVRALVEQLPEQQRPDVVADWSELIDQLDGKSDRAAKATIARWLERMENGWHAAHGARLRRTTASTPPADEAK